MIIDKKWTLVQPLGDWGAPPIDNPWTNNSFINMSRLLRANAYNTKSPNIEKENADIVDMISFDIGIIEYEIELVRRLKAKGSKVIVGFSQDLRFLIGNNGLIHDSTGTMYTDLCREVDLIFSGVSPKFKIYGRFQDKVFHMGEFLERINFSKIPLENRPIDIVLSGPQGEHFLPFTLEIALMLKERNPNLNIVYAIREGFDKVREVYRDKIVFSHEHLINLLPLAKLYINPELRPRPGRGMMEAFYCRTPFICSDMTYYSCLFPEYAFSCLSIVDIVETAEKILNSNLTEIMKKGEQEAEKVYFDTLYPQIIERLYK